LGERAAAFGRIARELAEAKERIVLDGRGRRRVLVVHLQPIKHTGVVTMRNPIHAISERIGAQETGTGASPSRGCRLAVPLLVGIGCVAVALIAFVAHSGQEAALAGKQRVPKLPARTYVNSAASTGLDTNGVRLFTVACDDGDHLLSGGFRDLDAGTQLVSSFPGGTGDNPHWTVEWRNAPNATDTVTLFAYCADFAPAH
jgi:hypothetical protein